MSIARGYTLIEVLIVIAILAFVVLLAAPLSGTWVSDANIQETQGQLQEAVGKAKSIALRNQMMALGGAPVAAICISNAMALTVRKGTAGVPPSCVAPLAGEQVWQTQISTKVSIKQSSTVVSCICFDNKGLVTTNDTCSTCANSTALDLIIGNQPAESFMVY